MLVNLMNIDGFWLRRGERLQGQLRLGGSWDLLQLEPVAALAPLGLAVVQPHELDVGVVLVADTPHHPVVRHGLDDVGVGLGALASGAHLAEERVLTKSKQNILMQKTHSELHKTNKLQALFLDTFSGFFSGF